VKWWNKLGDMSRKVRAVYVVLEEIAKCLENIEARLDGKGDKV
jgi:hypothetical protein